MLPGRYQKYLRPLFIIKRWYSNTIKGTIADKNITLSTGTYASLADGTTVLQCGGTSVLVTAVSRTTSLPNTTFVPLTVDYRETGAAVGRIPQNFLRRELRSSDREILISRLIDRSIRTLFPEGYFYETQVICNTLAIDEVNDPDVLCINGASASLSISDIPWYGPIAAVRVGLCDGKFIINPSRKQQSSCQLNVVLTCTEKAIVMLDAFGHEVPEEKLCEAVRIGFEQAQSFIGTIKKFQESNRKPLRNFTCVKPCNEIQEIVSNFCFERIWEILKNHSHKKMSRDNELFGLYDTLKNHIKLLENVNTANIDTSLIEQSFWSCVKQAMNRLVLDENLRCDGRGLSDLRPIECEVDLFEPLHGSARFRRGETQVLSIVTFGSIESAAKLDTISQIIGGQRSRNFMLHYEFPPFANNVTGRVSFTGRREIGHGNLAERGVQPIVPSDFPFTIRVSTQVTDSNGSSSMATVCSSSLAMFDAGVPMSKSVAGVAYGLMMETEHESQDIKRYQILTDLSGIEDATGHTDFKIAGTRNGITSCQLDVKGCHGLPYEIVAETLIMSQESRHRVLDIMDSCREKPRMSMKPNTPVYENIEIPLSKRHKLVGAGGHRIRHLIEETGAQLNNIDEEIMSIFAPSQTIMDEVLERVNSLLNAPEHKESSLEMGAIYTAKVIDIKPFGLLMELEPSGVKALLHSSQIDHKHIVHPDELGFQLGQSLSVKYFGRDPAGRVRISRKALLKNPFKNTYQINNSSSSTPVSSLIKDLTLSKDEQQKQQTTTGKKSKKKHN